MTKYWQNIFSILDSLSPFKDMYIDKLILTEEDLLSAPLGYKIGDIVRVHNPNYELKVGKNV